MTKHKIVIEDIPICSERNKFQNVKNLINFKFTLRYKKLRNIERHILKKI